MSLLEVSNLKFKYLDEELYNDVSFRLFEGDHMGLVGINGSGKSTFMKLIAKMIKPDAGKIEWMPKVTYAYLDQHLTIKQSITIKEYLYDVFTPLFNKEREMEELYNKVAIASPDEYEKLLNRAYSIQEMLEENNFYAFKSSISNVMSGLGISQDLLDYDLKKLSGGTKIKVMLAKMLLEDSQVLLLDEPTNFLDVAHVEWLKKYLSQTNKTFVVISHDEDFLNDTCNVIACLENRVITRYKAKYEDFLVMREMNNENYIQQYNNQQKVIKKTQEFIDKNIVRATTSKRAKSRQKMLDKMEVLQKPEEIKNVTFRFPKAGNLGVMPLEVNDLVVGYDFPILPKLSFEIHHNEKVVITGKNGIGKSTILKTLTNKIKALDGSFRFMDNVKINYFEQEANFDLDITPFNFILSYYPTYDNKTIRSILAKSGIDASLVNKKMRELSGGEQTKVRLALMTQIKSNFIIIDEPTNHLDVYAKEALKKALKEFDGVVLLVSHEKEFYQDLIDTEISIDDMI